MAAAAVSCSRAFLLRNYAVSTKISAVNLCENRYVHADNKHIHSRSHEIKESYKLLNLPDDCNLSQLRDNYIHLAKIYHPDGGLPTSDSKKFADVEQAYKAIKKQLLAELEAGKVNDGIEPDDEDLGIKHMAPQHRQYLSYEGVGYGNISQRQKQYQQYKVSKAVDAVHEHRIQKLASQNEDGLIVRDKTEAKKHKIRNAIERLVEDLIQESMAKGDFENLPGKGKPLQKSAYNPYIDAGTQKLNEVLINNGFTPQWILLEKEIRKERASIKEKLKIARRKFGRTPLTNNELVDWYEQMSRFQDDIKALNSKINNFNLLVPILNKQMVHFQLEKEANKILQMEPSKFDGNANEVEKKEVHQRPASEMNNGFLRLLSDIF